MRLVRNPDLQKAQVLNPDLAEQAREGALTRT